MKRYEGYQTTDLTGFFHVSHGKTFWKNLIHFAPVVVELLAHHGSAGHWSRQLNILVGWGVTLRQWKLCWTLPDMPNIATSCRKMIKMIKMKVATKNHNGDLWRLEGTLSITQLEPKETPTRQQVAASACKPCEPRSWFRLIQHSVGECLSECSWATFLQMTKLIQFEYQFHPICCRWCIFSET